MGAPIGRGLAALSGSTIGGVVGAVIGAYFGNAQLGWMIGSAIGGAIDPEVIEGPRLRDAQGVTAAEGTPRPFGYGAFVCGGNLIQAGNVIERRVRSDGKGGPVAEESRGYLTFALRICEGPITGIRRAWWNNKLVYSAAGDSIDKESRKAASKLRFYLGGEDQNPDPALEALPVNRGGGVGNVPAYCGTAYMVADMLDITDSGVAIGDWRFEVVVDGHLEEVAAELAPMSSSSSGQIGSIPEGLAWTYYGTMTVGHFTEMTARSSGSAEESSPCYFRVRHNGAVIYESGWLSSKQFTSSDIDSWKAEVLRWYEDDIGDVWRSTTNRMEISEYLDSFPSSDTVVEKSEFLQMPPGLTEVAVELLRTSLIPTSSSAVITATYPDIGIVGSYTLVPDIGNAILTQDGRVLFLSETNSTYVVVPEQPSLASIVSDLNDRVGIHPSLLDLTQLTQRVRGFMVGRQMESNAAVRTLQDGFFFDFPEFDGKRRAVQRGGPDGPVINPGHILYDSEDEETRSQVIEFPWKVNLIAPDPNANYEPAKQISIRRTYSNKALSEVTVEVPISFTRDENAQVADVMQKALWEGATGRRTITLPEEYSHLVPSDCPRLDGKRWRIFKREEMDGEYKFEMERDRREAYSSIAKGSTGIAPLPPISTLRGSTMLVPMNLPRLRTQDIGPGVYVAGRGLLPGWYGYDLQMSLDGGETFFGVYSQSGGSKMGYLLSEFGIEPLHVQMYQDEQLDSATPAQLAAKMNAAALSGAEIVQFSDSIQIEAQEYELSNVARALQGTDVMVHPIGASFVLLDDAIRFIPIDPSYIGKTIYFRPVSFGTAPENSPVYTMVYLPKFTGATTIEPYTIADGEPYTTATGDPYLMVT